MATVLLIEDEFVVLLALKCQLEDLGLDVLTARYPEEAVDMARDHRKDIHLILTDIGLPGQDGISTIDQIRRIPELRKIPVMAVTAYGDDRAQRALDAGFKLVLTKPLLREQLAEAIESVLGAGK